MFYFTCDRSLTDKPSVVRRRASKHDQVEVDKIVEVGGHEGHIQSGSVTVVTAVYTHDGRMHPASSGLVGDLPGPLGVSGCRCLTGVVEHVLTVSVIRGLRLYKRKYIHQ